MWAFCLKLQEKKIHAATQVCNLYRVCIHFYLEKTSALQIGAYGEISDAFNGKWAMRRLGLLK